jgi:hypothetical protein
MSSSGFPHPNYSWFEIRCPGRYKRQLVQAKSIADMVQRLGKRPSDVHLSIFRYGPEAIEYSKQEIPEIDKGMGSIKRFEGPCYADGLWIDIDGENAGDLDAALEILLSVVEHLEEVFSLPMDAYTVYFSGRRGFHIYIPLSVFGVDFYPSPMFADLLYEMFVMLLADSGLISETAGVWGGTGFDVGIYKPLHLIRMPHTIHPDTQMWKNPLRKDDLKSVDTVRQACQEPRIKYVPKKVVSPETALIGGMLLAQLEQELFKNQRPDRIAHQFDPTQISSVSELKKLDLPGFSRYVQQEERTLRALTGPIKQGSGFDHWAGRNEVLAHLVGKAKTAWRMDKEVAMAVLHLWNQSVVQPPLEEDEFISVFNSIYGR